MGDYLPAYSRDVALLGGPATTTVKSVRVSTGEQLWEDTSVGETAGRYPLLSESVALYHGRAKVVAADAVTGQVFWSLAASTAQAPLSQLGNQLHFLDTTGNLRALNRSNGQELWSASGVGADGSNIVATPAHVFVNNPDTGELSALDAAGGALRWNLALQGTLSTPQGLALAYDHLYAFCDDLGNGLPGVQAIDPDTGEILWTAEEPSPSPGAIEHAFAANGALYFYNTVLEQIRVLGAFSGVLLWSIDQPEVRGLAAAADHSLIVLLANEVQIYESSRRIHFAHIADGGGQTTLVTLDNLSGQTATGSVDFFDSQGEPLVVGVEDIGTASSVLFSIPPLASTKIQTLGLGPEGRPGWALVHSDQPLHGSSIFQFTQGDVILLEAGVAHSAPTGSANLFVSNLMTAAGNRLSTGVAIANPSGQTSTSVLTLLDEDGDFLVDFTLVLEPGQQLPRFIHELFPDEASGNFQGTLLVNSDQPVVITALRTQNDLQTSSFPVGQRTR